MNDTKKEHIGCYENKQKEGQNDSSPLITFNLSD